MKNSRKTLGIAAIAVLSLTLAAPAAFAQSGADGYGAQGPATLEQTLGSPTGDTGTEPVQRDVADDPATVGTADVDNAGATLPFTGVDLSLLAVAGGLLLMLGVGMRRLTRAPDSA